MGRNFGRRTDARLEDGGGRKATSLECVPAKIRQTFKSERTRGKFAVLYADFCMRLLGKMRRM